MDKTILEIALTTLTLLDGVGTTQEQFHLSSIVEKLEKLRDGKLAQDDKKESESRKQDREYLLEYIYDNYENCENMRAKIGNEGTFDFYFFSTCVPCSYALYRQFAADGDCWCGNCEREL